MRYELSYKNQPLLTPPVAREFWISPKPHDQFLDRWLYDLRFFFVYRLHETVPWHSDYFMFVHETSLVLTEMFPPLAFPLNKFQKLVVWHLASKRWDPKARAVWEPLIERSFSNAGRAQAVKSTGDNYFHSFTHEILQTLMAQLMFALNSCLLFAIYWITFSSLQVTKQHHFDMP